MRRIICVAIVCLLSITVLALVYSKHTEFEEKSKLVRLVLEERMKSDPVEGSLLIVETPLISNLDLPSDVGGVQVMLITMDQLKAQGRSSTSIHAILFTNITLIDSLNGFIYFSTYYGSYWPDIWNQKWEFYFKKILGVWVIDSKIHGELL